METYTSKMQVDPSETYQSSAPFERRTAAPDSRSKFYENCNVNYSEPRYYVPGFVAGVFLTMLMALASIQYNMGWLVAVFCGTVIMVLCACMGPLLSACIQLCDRDVPLPYEYDML